MDYRPNITRLGRALCVTAAVLACAGAIAAQTRINVPLVQVTRLAGAMPNELTGVGLVTGLNGTGSGDRASRQAALNLIQGYGLNVQEGDLTTGSFAMVAVNATLPPFAKEGQQLDIKVSTLTDATSLFGGYLQMTPLEAVDKKVYATARGPLTVSGFGASAKGTSVTRNHLTTAAVVDGATVVDAPASYYLTEKGDVELTLVNPDLMTAENITRAANTVLQGSGCKAMTIDRTTVRIEMPLDKQTRADAIRVLGLVRPVKVEVHNPAVVVIDAAAGVVLAGEGVMISPCVVALQDLTISVVSEDVVSQPLPGRNFGTTEIVNRTRIDIDSEKTTLKPVQGGATVAELLANLKALELSPRHLIQVFEHLAAGGYLQAELLKR